MMNKHEAVRAILDGQGADRIPVMMNIGSLSFVRYGYDMFEVMRGFGSLCDKGLA